MEDIFRKIFYDYNNTNNTTSNLFTFTDESNKFQKVSNYQKNLSNLMTDYGPLILSESISQSCNINTVDKITYINKLAELQNIINSCSLAENKEECFYNQFMKDSTLNLINDLSNIVKKINTTCINSSITPTIKQEMCANKNVMLNNYSPTDITKIKDFVVKYNNVIKSIKNISDNYLSYYLNNCNYEPEKINAYRDLQSTLSSTLFDLSETDATLTTQINNLTRQNNILSEQLDTYIEKNRVLKQTCNLPSTDATGTDISGTDISGNNNESILDIIEKNILYIGVGIGIVVIIIIIAVYFLVIKKKKMRKITNSRNYSPLEPFETTAPTYTLPKPIETTLPIVPTVPTAPQYTPPEPMGSNASILGNQGNQENKDKQFKMLFSGLKTLGNYVK